MVREEDDDIELLNDYSQLELLERKLAKRKRTNKIEPVKPLKRRRIVVISDDSD